MLETLHMIRLIDCRRVIETTLSLTQARIKIARKLASRIPFSKDVWLSKPELPAWMP